MAVSKRLRFEILRRDNHQCRYCGATAPDVPLTVDHVVPVALGGPDESSNLVTACRDCNAGKSSASPDARVVEQVSQDAIRWAKAMEQAAHERYYADKYRKQIVEYFEDSWNRWSYEDWRGDSHLYELPAAFATSILQLYDAGITGNDMDTLIDVAMGARTDARWRYFCGCCWRRVRQAQDRAVEILREEGDL